MQNNDDFLTNNDDIQLIAKEYAKKLENEEQNILSKTTNSIFKKLNLLKSYYAKLKTFAKPNAVEFVNKLEFSVEKRKNLMLKTVQLFDEISTENLCSLNNYTNIFKECLKIENHLSHLFLECKIICVSSQKTMLFEEMCDITNRNINHLIDCI